VYNGNALGCLLSLFLYLLKSYLHSHCHCPVTDLITQSCYFLN